MVSIIYEHLCATNVWWCLYGLCWSYNGVSLVFGGGVVTLEVQWKCPHALAIVFYPSTLLQYQLLHTTLPTRFNHVPHIGNNGIEMQLETFDGRVNNGHCVLVDSSNLLFVGFNVMDLCNFVTTNGNQSNILFVTICCGAL